MSVNLAVLGFLRRLFGRRAVDPLAGLDAERTRLIVGLGNPGPAYADTRHNLGFRCVEALARDYGATWHDRPAGLDSLVTVIHPTDATPIVLAKPLTFMNRSGTAVRALLDHLGLGTEQCLIVYDDMDLPWRALRVRERGSPGTHNGMRSVAASLGTLDVPRLRIGIGQASPGQAISHVLSEFGPEEGQIVDHLISRAAEAALAWALDGAAVAMNRYNKS